MSVNASVRTNGSEASFFCCSSASRLLNSDIVNRPTPPNRSVRNARRIVAAVFLLFLFVEWGSHGLAFSHSASSEGAAIHSSESGHDDPCKTLIRCSDGRQQDLQTPRYDGSQHTGFLSGLFEAPFRFDNLWPPPPDRDRVDRLDQPESPPFHPPERLWALALRSAPFAAPMGADPRLLASR
jgi:hypothetical protein